MGEGGDTIPLLSPLHKRRLHIKWRTISEAPAFNTREQKLKTTGIKMGPFIERTFVLVKVLLIKGPSHSFNCRKTDPDKITLSTNQQVRQCRL